MMRRLQLRSDKLSTCLWAFMWPAVVFLCVGCQSMTGRFRPPLEGVEAGADDDWAPPKVNSRYSQPNAYMRKDRQHQEADRRVSNSVEDKSSGTRVVADDAKTANPKIVETNAQELDVDAAVAALPPNLQETARRQLAAMRSKNANPTEPKSATVPTKSEPMAAAKVSAKLSDSVDDSNEPTPVDAVPTASGRVAAHNQPTVTTAIATESAVSGPSDAKAAAVVTASALSPPKNLDAKTNWSTSLDDAIADLEKQIAEETGVDENLRLSREMTLRMLYLSQRRLNDAVRPIEGLDANEQEYLRHQAQALYEASNPDAMPIRSRRWSLVMNSQRQATNKLAAASNLEVRSPAFCNDVQGYGLMTKFPKYQFQADQEVLLYCELENVLAEPVKTGFETQLQGTYEILDANGKRVTDQLLPVEKETCRNHRRDYFIGYHIYMPTRIEPGQYQMRITIEDMKAKKFGQAQLDFEIVP